jgi:hypothetical protein
MRKAPRAITRWSQYSESTVPPAGQWPVIAATIGTDERASRSCSRKNASMKRRSGSAGALVTSRTSSPALKSPGCPDSTSARAPCSGAATSSASRRCTSAMFSALTGGLASRSSRTGPWS